MRSLNLTVCSWCGSQIATERETERTRQAQCTRPECRNWSLSHHGICWEWVCLKSLSTGCFRIMFSMERLWINKLSFTETIWHKDSGNKKPKTEHVVGQIWPTAHGLLTSDLEQGLAHSLLVIAIIIIISLWHCRYKNKPFFDSNTANQDQKTLCGT